MTGNERIMTGKWGWGRHDRLWLGSLHTLGVHDRINGGWAPWQVITGNYDGWGETYHVPGVKGSARSGVGKRYDRGVTGWMGVGRHDRLLQDSTMSGKKPTMCWGVMGSDCSGDMTGDGRIWQEMGGYNRMNGDWGAMTGYESKLWVFAHDPKVAESTYTGWGISLTLSERLWHDEWGLGVMTGYLQDSGRLWKDYYRNMGRGCPLCE